MRFEMRVFLVCVWVRTVRVELGYFQRKLKTKTLRNCQKCAAQSGRYFDLADIEIDKSVPLEVTDTLI